MSVRADLVKYGKLTDLSRPGIAKPFMVPTKLKNQVLATPKTDLWYDPTGKNRAGQTQWTIAVQRPGIAQPLITAKEEKISSDAIVQAMQNRSSPGVSITQNVARAEVAEANANNQGNPNDQPSGIAGFFAGWGRSSRPARRTRRGR